MAHRSGLKLEDIRNLTDPAELYARLRQDPVAWSDEFGGWFLSQYVDVKSALLDGHLSNERISHLKDELPGMEDVLKDYVRVLRGALFMTDPPTHTRLRKLTRGGFTHSSVERWRTVIQGVVDSCLDKVEKAGRMDIVADFADPIPSIFMAELFNISAEDRDEFFKWSVDLAAFFGSPLGDIKEKARLANEGTRKLEEYFLHLITLRRQKPGQDLVSFFIQRQEEGTLSEAEVSAQCVALLAAGTTTTADQLSNSVDALLRSPDQLQRLQRDSSLIVGAVQETLRYEPAAPFIYKLATDDVTVAGQEICKGQRVFLGFGPANRDPEIFADPDRLDVKRSNSRQHLAFGSGPHWCLGADLASVEIEIALGTLLRRMPNLHFDERRPTRRRWESVTFRGFSELPVVF